MTRVLALLERLPLRIKLILGFATLGALVLVLGVQSLRTQDFLKADMRRLYQQELAGMEQLQEARVQMPHLVQGLQHAVNGDSEVVRSKGVEQFREARKKSSRSVAAGTTDPLAPRKTWSGSPRSRFC